MKKTVVSLLLAFALLALPSCSFLPQEEELPKAPVIAGGSGQKYEQIAVQRGDLVQTDLISIKYAANAEEDLSFATAGLAIQEVYVQVGDTVKAGDLLAELTSDDVRNQISSQESALASLNAEYSYYKQTRQLTVKSEQLQLAESQEKLNAGTTTITAHQALLASFEKSASAYQVQCSFYEESLRIEHARLAELHELLKTRQLFAGIDGSVLFVAPHTIDTRSDPSSVFITISDYSGGYFSGTSDTEDLFKPGDKHTVTVKQKDYAIVVRSVDPYETGSKFNVIFDLLEPDPQLEPDSLGQLTVTIDSRKNVLYLPTSCIHQLSHNPYVYFINEKGVKQQQAVTVGLEARSKIEIISGLKEGDMVLK